MKFLVAIIFMLFRASVSERNNATGYAPPLRCVQDVYSKFAECNDRNLSDVPDYLFEDILHLDLSWNIIKTLRNSSLLRYVLLIDLDLSHNEIKYIETAALYPLLLLRRLDLTSNPHIPLQNPDVFKLSRNLTDLILYKCEFRSIPQGMLTFLPSLRKLDLSFNHLTSVNITSCGAVLIEYVNLENNQINSLSVDFFDFTCRHNNLQLTGNPIQYINSNAISKLNIQGLTIGNSLFTSENWNQLFRGVAKSTIKRLSLHYTDTPILSNRFFYFYNNQSSSLLYRLNLAANGFRSILWHTFSNFTTVRELILSRNEIETIEPEFFIGMEILHFLDLSKNNINTINPLNSTWCLTIKILNLEANQLTVLNQFSFYGLDNLTDLALQNNYNLVILHITSFSELLNLERIDLENCNIAHLTLYAPALKLFSYPNQVWKHSNPFIPGKTFQNMKGLQLLFITMSLSSSSLISRGNISLFDGLHNLRTLYLNRNSLAVIPNGVFQKLNVLEKFYMSSCGILFFDVNFLAGLKSLKILDLSLNKIKRIPLLTDLIELTNLGLFGNKLNYINENTFSKNQHLNEISLQNNFFTGFNQSTLRQLNSSSLTLDISSNPFTCNCRMTWLLEWMKGPVKILNENGMICSASLETIEEMRDREIIEFNYRKLCGEKKGIFTSIPLTVITICVIGVFTYYFRWNLKHKLFLLKLAFLGYDEIQDAKDHRDFEFDLNIMYAEHDKLWVENRLIPSLQEKLPEFNRNSVGEDKLIVGMFYLDAVYQVIENSFKTVILFTRAAMQDNLFLLKFQMATDHENDKMTQNTVVIFLEDLLEEEMPFMLRLYLSNHNSYLSWVDDEGDEESFWDTLIKMLEVNLKFNPLIPTE